MSSVNPSHIDNRNHVYRPSTSTKLILVVTGIGTLFTIAILALSITILIKVNKGLGSGSEGDGGTQPTTSSLATTTTTTTTPLPSSTTTITSLPSTSTLATATAATTGMVSTVTDAITTSNSLNPTLAESIRIADVMTHLNELQRIATAENGNRAVTTQGFNRTLDYITNYLASNTDYDVSKAFFPIRQFALASNPSLISSINGVIKNYTYSTDLSAADFYFIQFSTYANSSTFVELTSIPNVGCTDADWLAANPSPAGRVALVKRGICAFSDKGVLAAKYNVAGLLIYNDGTSPDRVSPIAIGLGQDNYLPALFLSFSVGQELANAAQNASTNAGVRLIIDVQNLPLSPVGNICADTKSGDATQTIVIGSHSDSVPAGPGINDNGSGSAANLGLAVALARLFQTSTYPKYKYRVRFCWWGAEEIGLLGSDFHVKQAKNSTTVGDRLTDYLINLNYDMLGSPNYIFGIYDGNTADPWASAGSNKTAVLFRDWFIRQKLPWDYTDFSGRSDYGPFLAEGIAAGGLFSGGDAVKTQEQRDRYNALLGQGMGGIAGVDQDPCYHKACDSIENINVFAYEKMVQAAAYVLESLAREDDLKTWLYPSGTKPRLDVEGEKRKYDSINEYFRMPYL